MSLFNLIAKTDLFGYHIKIKHKNSGDYKSIYGALFSIVVYLALIVQIIFSFNQMNSGLNPSLNLFEQQENNNQTLSLSSSNTSNFIFAVQLKQKGNNDVIALSEIITYFNINLITDKNSNQILKKEPNNNFIVDSNCIVNGELLADTICYKNNITLYEYYNLRERHYTKLDLDFNQKLDSNNYSVYLYFPNFYFDSLDFYHPIKQQVSIIEFDLKELLYLEKISNKIETSIIFVKHELNEYYNILINPMISEKRNFYNIRPYSETTLIKEKNQEDSNLTIILKTSIFSNKIIRRYFTPVDVLADIGGLFSIFTWVGTLLFNYINKQLFIVDMINTHFKIVNEDEISITNENLNTQNDFKTSIVKGRKTSNDYLSNESFFTKISNKELKEELFRSSKLNKFNYGLKDIVFSAFCCYYFYSNHKNKYDIYLKSKKILDIYLNLNTLIKTIQEFKIVKNVMFDSLKKKVISDYKQPIIKVSDKSARFIYRQSDLKERRSSKKSSKNVEIELIECPFNDDKII